MKKFLRGSSILMFGDLLTKVLSLLYVIPLVAINESIPTYTQHLVTAFAFVIVLSGFGINFIITNDVAKYYSTNEDELKTTLINSLIFMLGISLVTTIFFYFDAKAIGSLYVSPRYDTFDSFVLSIKITSISIILFSLTSYVNAILTGLGEYKSVSISLVVEQFLKIGILFFGILYFTNILNIKESNYALMTYLVTAASLIGSLFIKLIILMYFMFKKRYMDIFVKGKYIKNKKKALMLYSSGIVYYFTTLYITVFDSIDLTHINILGSKMYDYDKEIMDKIVNEYTNFSYKFIQLPIQLSSAFVAVMFKSLQDSKDTGESFNKIMNYVFLYSLICMTGLFFVTNDIISFLYNPSVIFNFSMLQSLLIPLYIFKNMYTSFLLTKGSHNKNLIVSSIMIIALKVALNYVFFEFFGINGFIISSIVATLVTDIYLIKITNSEIKLQYFDKSLRKYSIIVTGITFSFMLIVSPLIAKFFANPFYSGFIKGIVIIVLFTLLLKNKFKIENEESYG